MASSDSNWNAIMQYSFLRVFANDGLIDGDELRMLQRLALQDGKVDAQERGVLSQVFSRVDPEKLEPGVWDEIQHFKARYEIP